MLLFTCKLEYQHSLLSMFLGWEEKQLDIHSPIQPELTGSLLGSPWEHEIEDTPRPGKESPFQWQAEMHEASFTTGWYLFFFYQSRLRDLTLSLISFRDNCFFLLLSSKYYFIQYVLIDILTECFLFSMINKELTWAKFPSLKTCSLVDQTNRYLNIIHISR